MFEIITVIGLCGLQQLFRCALICGLRLVRAIPLVCHENTFGARNRFKHIISGCYSVYPAPNSVVHFFVSTKLWLCGDLVAGQIHGYFTFQKRTVPRTSLDDGQLLGATIVTTSSFWYSSTSKWTVHSVFKVFMFFKPQSSHTFQYYEIPDIFRIPIYFTTMMPYAIGTYRDL